MKVESEGELVLPAALRYTSPDYIHLSMIATNILVNQGLNIFQSIA